MSKRVDKMKKALMRSNTRLLLTAVMLLQALTMLVIAFRGSGIQTADKPCKRKNPSE